VLRLFQAAASLAAALFLALMIGCGSGHGYRPVTGSVKYSDGSPPNSQMATVTFEPVSQGADVKGASGTIREDGTFELSTIDPGDGALPGEYRVTVKIMDGYPQPVYAVAKEFTDATLTPLKATVAASGKNHFDFEVERAKP